MVDKGVKVDSSEEGRGGGQGQQGMLLLHLIKRGRIAVEILFDVVIV